MFFLLPNVLYFCCIIFIYLPQIWGLLPKAQSLGDRLGWGISLSNSSRNPKLIIFLGGKTITYASVEIRTWCMNGVDLTAKGSDEGNLEKLGSKFPTFALKSNSESDEITLFQGPETVGL